MNKGLGDISEEKKTPGKSAKGDWAFDLLGCNVFMRPYYSIVRQKTKTKLQ
jgi:hypothetical protein